MYLSKLKFQEVYYNNSRKFFEGSNQWFVGAEVRISQLTELVSEYHKSSIKNNHIHKRGTFIVYKVFS